MPFLNPKLGIDFSDYIADRTTNFTGREWVFKAIQNWLTDPKGDRFFLLTGEPGGGKTAIAARLAQFAQGVVLHPRFDAGFLHAVHFCSARDSVWTDPKEFVRSIALQLAQSIPKFGLALKDIGEKTTNINVDISVGTAQNSTMQGVVIQNLTISGLTGQEAFTQVVVNPLRQIQEEGFNQPVTILVDSLDEALTHDGESTIVGLLSKLSSSIKVRFILTSRDEARVRNVIKSAKRLLLSDPEDLERIQQNQEDIGAYVRKRLVEDEVLMVQLESLALSQREEHIETITNKSDGNFLYVRFLLDAIASGERSITNLEGLPQGLEELYYESLERVVALEKKKDWSEDYAPLMGVLLAAQASLNLKQLKAFTGQGETAIFSCLNNLRQFLDKIELKQDEYEYRIYHQSVADFLGKRSLFLDGEKSENLYYLSPQEQHQRIVEYYHPEDKPWIEVKLEKIDSYGRRYLAQHLVKADQVEELHLLLSLEKEGKNAWFKVNDDEGDVAGFLADIELAWVQADEAYHREPGKSIGLQCRYALMTTSVNSLSAQLPIGLMVALVEYKYWTLKKLLAYITQIPNSEQRAKTLVTLCQLLGSTLLEANKKVLYKNALQAIEIIKDTPIGKGNLRKLSNILPEEFTAQYLKIAQSLEPFERCLSLIAIADRCLQDIIPQILEAVQFVKNSKDRKEILVAVANKLPEQFIPQYLQAAQPLELIDQCKALIAVIGRSLEETTPQILKAIESAVDLDEDQEGFKEVLIELAPQLPEQFISQYLQVTQSLNPSYQVEILSAMAHKRPNEILPLVLQVVQDIDDGNAASGQEDSFLQTKALVNLAERYPAEILPKYLQITQAIEDPSQKSDALKAVGNKLTCRFIPSYLESVRTIDPNETETYLAEALIAVKDKLKNEHVSQYLGIAETIEDKLWRAKVLGAVVGKAPEIIPSFLKTAEAIEDAASRAKVLGAAVGKYPEIVPSFLKAAEAIEDAASRAKVLGAVVGKAPEIIPSFLKAAEVVEDATSRVKVLRTVVNKSLKVIPSILETIAYLEETSDQAETLIAILSKVPDHFIPQYLQAAQTIQSPLDQAEALIVAIQKHPEAIIPLAYQAARSINDISYQVATLLAMSNKFPAKIIPLILQAIQSLKNEFDRAEVLVTVSSRLPKQFVSQYLEISHGIESISLRARALSAIVGISSKEAMPLIIEYCQFIKKPLEQTEVLIAIADKIPKKFVPQYLKIAQSIEDATLQVKALTAITDKISKKNIPQYLKVVLSVENSVLQVKVLSQMADKHPQEIFPSILQLIRKLQDYQQASGGIWGSVSFSPRSEALVEVADKLTEEFVPLYLEVTQSITASSFQAELLIAVSHKLSGKYISQYIKIAKCIDNSCAQAKVLSSIVDKAPEEIILALEAVQNIEKMDYWHWVGLFSGSRASSQAEALILIANQLTQPFVTQYLQIVKSIEDEHEQAKALAAIAAKFPEEAIPLVLKIAQNVQEKLWHNVSSDQAETLILIGEKLSEPFISQYLEIAQKIEKPCSRAKALAAIATKCPEEVTSLILETIKEISLYERGKVLSEIACELENFIPQYLEIVQSIEDVSLRAKALSKVVSRYPDKVVNLILQIAQSIPNRISHWDRNAYFYRSEALIAVSDKITEDLISQYLQIAQTIEDESERSKVLIAVSDKITEDLISQYLQIAQTIEDESERSNILGAVAPLLSKLPIISLEKIWQTMLHILGNRTRCDLLSDFEKLAPVINTLGGDEAILEFAYTVEQVSRWWS